MKYVVTHRGEVKHLESCQPAISDLSIGIKTQYSAVSIGTELGLIHNPAVVEPHPLGYSAAGVVVSVGSQVEDFEIGDIVACYGGPYVFHAEELAVPRNLCVKVPRGVSTKDASFVGLGAVAIHGVRRLGLQFGESVIVVGLGVLGQLVAQICHQANYRVIATDMRTKRCQLAKSLGIPNVVDLSISSADDVNQLIQVATEGHGVDGVIICAHSESPAIIEQALDWIALRGKVVVLGNVPITFPREKFFQKEADLYIARGAGPGRYDLSYEKEGVDYPQAFVRWTEGRNMKEFIRQLSEKRLQVGQLISHEFSFYDAPTAYQTIQQLHDVVGAVFVY